MCSMDSASQVGYCVKGVFFRKEFVLPITPQLVHCFSHKDAIVGFVFLSILLLFSLDYLATAFVYHKAIIFLNKMIPPE